MTFWIFHAHPPLQKADLGCVNAINSDVPIQKCFWVYFFIIKFELTEHLKCISLWIITRAATNESSGAWSMPVKLTYKYGSGEQCHEPAMRPKGMSPYTHLSQPFGRKKRMSSSHNPLVSFIRLTLLRPVALNLFGVTDFFGNLMKA